MNNRVPLGSPKWIAVGMETWPLLYLITDRNQTHGCKLQDVLNQAVRGGAALVQIREKDLSAGELFHLTKELKEVVKQSNGKILINDRLDIALSLGLDGVHLGQSGFPVKEARKMMPREMLLGVSTHSLSEAINAERDGADFITFGPVYPTPSKIKYGAPVGLNALTQVLQRVTIPIFAIGGISLEKIAIIKGLGCNRVAVISAIIASSDVYSATREMLEALAKRI